MPDFNPTSNGGDVKQGMGDEPTGKAASLEDLSDEQVAKVADLIAESISGMDFGKAAPPDGPLTRKIVEKAEEMGKKIEQKTIDPLVKKVEEGPGKLLDKGINAAPVDTKGLMGTDASLNDEFPLLLG